MSDTMQRMTQVTLEDQSKYRKLVLGPLNPGTHFENISIRWRALGESEFEEFCYRGQGAGKCWEPLEDGLLRNPCRVGFVSLQSWGTSRIGA